jgi:translation initiation factor IF-3
VFGFLFIRRLEIKELKVNQDITAEKMNLIDEQGQMQGLVSRDQALYLAYEKETDLVLINESINPPIAKLMDYGKYIYNQTKQISKQRAKAHDVELKEVRLGIKISEHDLQVKIAQTKKFLEKGDKVKVTVQLKGREMMFRDKVEPLISRFKNEANADYEKSFEKMGNRFFVTLTKAKNESKNI